MKIIDQKYFDNPEKYIPIGIYCYTIKEIVNNGERIKVNICPFWDSVLNDEGVYSGYCHLMKDYDLLLDDQCKICDINDFEFEEE